MADLDDLFEGDTDSEEEETPQQQETPQEAPQQEAPQQEAVEEAQPEADTAVPVEETREEENGVEGGTAGDGFGEDGIVPPEEQEAEEYVRNIHLPPIGRFPDDENLYNLRLPNFLEIDNAPFSEATYEDENLHEEGDFEQEKVLMRCENVIRWRYKRDEDGNITTEKETNAKFVKWEDGSVQLFLGKEVFDVNEIRDNRDNHVFALHDSSGAPLNNPSSADYISKWLEENKPDKSELTEKERDDLALETGERPEDIDRYVKSHGLLECCGVFSHKFTIRPIHSKSSTHKALAQMIASKHRDRRNVSKTTVQVIDPVEHRRMMLQEQEKRLRATDQLNRRQSRAQERIGLTSSYMAGDLGSIKAAYKRRPRQSLSEMEEQDRMQSERLARAQEEYEEDDFVVGDESEEEIAEEEEEEEPEPEPVRERRPVRDDNQSRKRDRRLLNDSDDEEEEAPKPKKKKRVIESSDDD